MRTERQRTMITPSVFDRLLDDTPKVQVENQGQYSFDISRLKRAVARDMEAAYRRNPDLARDTAAGGGVGGGPASSAISRSPPSARTARRA